MKYLFALFFSLATVSAFTQKIYTRNDSILITQDSITIQAGLFKGKIQWQKSLDGKNWLNLDGRTSDLLKVKPDTEAFYRLKVTEGNCLPVYSDTAWIAFTVPEVSTSIAKDINYNSALIGGNILSNGGAPVSERGVCYSLTQTPTVTNTKIVIGAGLGEFNYTINDLIPNTTYYTRAYAINSKGIAYGNQIQLTTREASIFTVSKLVNASFSDSIIAPDKAILRVPANSLQISGTISIGITGNEPQSVPNQNIQIVGKSYTLGFPGDLLLNSVQLSFPLPTIEVPLENYSLFLYNGESYIPIEYTVNGNTVTAIIDNINWRTNPQTLKDSKLLSEIIIVGLVAKQMPPPKEMGLKEVSLVSGELKFTEPSSSGNSKILLLVHGWIGSPQVWKSFIPKIQSETDLPYSKIWTFGYNSSLSVESNGAKLAQALNNYTGGAKVDIVAHSMGGLISREMLEYNEGSQFTNKLITLGTPHRGSPLATIRLMLGDIVSLEGNLVEKLIYDYTTKGFRDLREGSTFIQKMMSEKNSALPYYLIAATNNGKYITDFCFTDLNDGIVSVPSAEGVPDCISPSPINIPVGSAHTQMTYDDKIYQQVLNYLREEKPTLNTSPVINITASSAQCGGLIVSNGGSDVTTYGICWSTSGTPSLLTGNSQGGLGGYNFISNLTGLTVNTTYYVRAYAINRAGVGYGDQVTFTTVDPVITSPIVNTTPIADITQTTATSGGNITSDGGAVVSERGVCWSTSQDPTKATQIPVSGSGTGSYTCNISGLTANTTYYVWAYAINSVGTGYGNMETFKTSAAGNLTGTFTDSRDGKTYKWVQIGTQTWMAENLAYLPAVSPPTARSSIALHYYVMDYSGTDVATAKANANYTTYGVLYNWPAALAASPPGWHLPSDDEWKQLEVALGMTQTQADVIGEFRGTDQGTQMKANSYWNNNGNGTNTSGFSGLPGDMCGSGNFGSIGYYGCWWSSTSNGNPSPEYALHRNLYAQENRVYRGGNLTENGFSVRCIKGDITANIVVPTITTNPITEITQTTATSGGNITSDGGAAITARGVCWSTVENPTTADNKTNDGTGTGSFISNLTGLTANTTYYLRAYATNSVGTAYGNEVTFKTSEEEKLTGTFTDNRDGHVYKWVKIGNQTWMAENLAYLPSVSSSGVAHTEPRYYVFNYIGSDVSEAIATENYKTYGVLYNWYGAKAACPLGWHLPSDEEWADLSEFLGGDSLAGGKLKEIGITHWNNPNTGATDELGFCALPSGSRSITGTFSSLGSNGYWWSSTRSTAVDLASGMVQMLYGTTTLSRSNYYWSAAYSVRCIKD